MSNYASDKDLEQIQAKMDTYVDKMMGVGGTGMVKTASPNPTMANHSYKQYRSSFLTLGDMQIPGNYRDIFRWCRYFFKFDPLIGGAVRSLATFPITDWILHDTKEHEDEETEDPTSTSDSKNERSDTYRFYKSMFDDVKLYKHLIEVGYDYFLYGNVIIFAEPGYKTVKHRDDNGNLYERKERVWKELQRLDNTRVRIDKDPKTNEKMYYYDIPAAMKNVIKTKKPKEKYDRIPEIFKKAVAQNKLVKLKSDYVYHLQMPSESGDDGIWATPPVLHVMKLILYTNVLRQAQESIAYEHIVPKRIYYFQQTNEYDAGSNFQAVAGDFAHELKKQLDDPNYQVISPLPIEQIKHGGHGKALMLVPEIEQLQETILAGMGVPREFIFGGLSYSGSTTSLRILENQFITYRTNLLDYINDFLIKRLAELRGEWEAVEDDNKLVTVTLSELKMQDDIQQKQLMINLNERGKVPDEVLYERVLGLDPEKISKQLQQEKMQHLKNQFDLQQEQMRMQQGMEQAQGGQAMPGQEAGIQQQQGGTPQEQQGGMPQEQQQQQQQERKQGDDQKYRRALSIAQEMLHMQENQRAHILQKLPEIDRKNVILLYNELLKQQQDENDEGQEQGEGQGDEEEIDMTPLPTQKPPRRQGGV